MKVEVVSVMSRTPDPVRENYYRPDIFLKSLDRFGVKPTILGHGMWWQGLMSKPRYLRKWLRDGNCKADALIVSDAFDVIFTEHPDKVGDKWGGGDEICFNAERGLFPRGDLAHHFPDTGSPFRYLNSGLMIGKPANILSLLEAMGLDDIHDDYQTADDLHGGNGRDMRWIHPNDQGHYQYAYAARPVPMTLDTRCEFFQCCSACSLEDFDMSGERIWNRLTGMVPMVFHMNGGSKNDLMAPFLQKWGLT